MKKGLLIVTSVVAFAGGLIGVATLLPKEPPDEETLDAAGDSLSAAEALEALTGAPADSLIHITLPTTTVDSLALLREQLALAQSQLPALLARLTELERAAGSQATRRERAQALSATLTRLDDDGLRALLTRLDADVLADVYAEASPRSRTKLLQALPATRGAALVERIAADDRRAIPFADPPDSTPPTDVLQPAVSPPSDLPATDAPSERPAAPRPDPERPTSPAETAATPSE